MRVHLGTLAGTLCGKPVKRRWWVKYEIGKVRMPSGAYTEITKKDMLRQTDCMDCRKVVEGEDDANAKT